MSKKIIVISSIVSAALLCGYAVYVLITDKQKPEPEPEQPKPEPVTQ